MAPVFTERSRRIWAAAEAQALGRGGTAVVAGATGISASTIRRGMRDVAAGDPLVATRTRKAGTLGVLRAGAELGLVNVPDVMARLSATSSYIDEALLKAVFERWMKP